MPEPKPQVPGLKSLLENVFGLQVDDEMKARLEKSFGTTYDDDPSRWTDIKRTLVVGAGEDPDAEGIVDAVVDRLRGELAGATAAPASWTPAERAVFASREVETAIEEGGPEGLRGDARPWIEDALAGYRLLGMSDHADVTERIAAALATTLSEEDIDDLMEDWLNVPNGDGPRAVWIAAHPEAFRA
jgi:hypothetical protein